MPQLYKRPPITEAVIEVRIENGISVELVERVRDRLLKTYPLPPQKVLTFNFELAEDVSKVQQKLEGYRLTAPDGATLVTIAPGFLATTRLAPYEGWKPFIASARDNWEAWKKIVGWQKIVRIGVRYINRIDIPNVESRILNTNDYLTFSVKRPSLDLPPMESFALNATSPLGKEDFTVILNLSSAPSPLVKTTSFILDIDIARDTNLPQNDEGLWDLIDRIRAHKNDVFEACITDAAREQFNR